MKTIKDLDIKDKNILVRVDYNVPIKNGKITDDLRIRASLPTLKYLRQNGADKIILISHLGRPEGRNPELSLKPIADHLNKLIGNVTFIDEVSGPKVKSATANLKPGQILLLENLRFFPGEKANSPEFIQDIVASTGADAYVQDGFAVVHRAHASTDAIKDFLPVYAGFLIASEVQNLENATKNIANFQNSLLIIGGAKVEDKQPLIDQLAPNFTHVFVGGKIAADGYVPDDLKIAVATDFDEDSEGRKLDIGPLSTGLLANRIVDADLIIWNGLLGYAEDPAYATASTIAAELIGEKPSATTIICGGDTTGFVENLMRDHQNLQYSLVSTGGGAALEFLLGKKLPGIEAILA
ncbi:phosphoglycerate kinase [Candidatus Saccharibacteria bacterium]|nr:phosphoglycerate kinase [Candidatus Saccharibacteria bacterium]